MIIRMPELPEVETITRILRQGFPGQPPVLGRRILALTLLWERTLAEPSVTELQTRLPGQVIEDITRRGKFIVMHLSRGWLLFHLRMSGDMAVRHANAVAEFHDRLLLELEGSLQLAFNDARKFGRVWLVDELEHVLGRLGPEPLDESFTARDLFSRLQHTHRQLKPLLLDQSFVAGLGNIYVDEALNVAGLHPLIPSNTLTEEQASKLLTGIRTVLLDGIARNGATIDWVYRGGDFQNYFRVYQRTGEPCPNCGMPIARIMVGQRSTHYCPHCQPLST
jgi:formamidopyrimidine-DNA glycosylase